MQRPNPYPNSNPRRCPCDPVAVMPPKFPIAPTHVPHPPRELFPYGIGSALHWVWFSLGWYLQPPPEHTHTHTPTHARPHPPEAVTAQQHEPVPAGEREGGDVGRGGAAQPLEGRVTEGAGDLGVGREGEGGKEGGGERGREGGRGRGGL